MFYCLSVISLCLIGCWLVHALPNANGPEVCGDAAWTYMPVSGKCYQRVGSVYAPVGRENARQRCASISGASLVRLDEEVNMFDLTAYCMSMLFTGVSIWADAVASPSNGSQWIWQATNASVSDQFWLTGGRPSTGQNCSRLVIGVRSVASGAHWVPDTGLQAESCTNNFSVICEKPARKCFVSQIRGLNPLTMVLSNVSYGRDFANLPHHGLLSLVRCRPGFYRDRDSPLWTASRTATPTAEDLLPNQAFCLANGSFAHGLIEPCYPIRCNATLLKFDMPIPHVKPYADQLVFDFYNYTHRFSVNCDRGYVSYRNSTSIVSDIACDQSFRDPTKGEWTPPDLNTCTAVKCDDINTVISSQAVPYKAENREDRKSYGEFQQSSFPYFPNLVSVKCRQLGYFFEDRQFEKMLRCDLANGSLIKAQWFGAQGTDLQRLKTMQCIPVSCLSDRIIRRTDDARTIVKNALYMANATISYGNGSVAIVPASEVNQPETYPFATVIAFRCENGSETGVGEPAVLCKADGQWNVSDLPRCIKKSEALQLQGNQKHYVPPAKEAGSAESVGAVVIMIVVVFCVLVVVLDLSTLSRDINLLKTNLRRLRHFKRH